MAGLIDNTFGSTMQSAPLLSTPDQRAAQREQEKREAKREEYLNAGFANELADALLDNNSVVSNAARAVADGFRKGEYGYANGEQMNDLARTLFTPRADGTTKLQEAYQYLGEGVGDFITGVIQSHANSGADARAFDTMLEIAKNAYEATGKYGRELASDVLAGYRNLGLAAYGTIEFDRKGNAGPFNARHARDQLALDAALAKTLGSLRGRGASVSDLFRDPEITDLVKKATYVNAMSRGFGVDLYETTRTAGKSYSDAIGDFIAGRKTGSPTPGNLVEAYGGLMDQLGAIIGGGREFENVNRKVTGDAAAYAADPTAQLAYTSKAPGCDDLAWRVQKGLYGYLAPKIASGMTAADAFEEAFASPAEAGRAMVSALAKELSPVFFGKDADRTAKILAFEAISQIRNRGGVNMQDLVENLAYFSPDLEKREPGAARILQSWARYNSVRAMDTREMRQNLEAHLSSFMPTASQAKAGASRIMEQCAEAERIGGNYMAPYINAMQNGVYYRPVLDDKGRHMRDQDFPDIPLWTPDIDNLEIARGDMDENEWRVTQAGAAADVKRLQILRDAQAKRQQQLAERMEMKRFEQELKQGADFSE